MEVLALMISLQNLSKTYKNKNGINNIFNDINIDFDNKGLFYILGNNGTGKSTIFNILLGRDLNYNGSYFFGNTNIADLNNKEISNFRNNNISVITQSTNLIKEFNVFDNIVIALNESNMTINDKKQLVSDALSSVNLAGFEERQVNTLSGGEAQRVAIARSLVNKPKVLLADEVTSNLDFETAEVIMDLLKELSNEYLIIMITHNNILVDKYPGIIYEIKDKTITSNTKAYELNKEIVNLDSNKTNYKNNFKIIKGLFNNKLAINLIYTILIMFSLILINLMFSHNTTSSDKVDLLSSYDNGLLVIEKSDDVVIDDEIILKSKYLDPLFPPDVNQINYNIRRIIEIDNFIETFNINGRLPSNRNEILVTDYYLDKLNLGFEDVINSTFEFRIEEIKETITITGILNTNYHELLQKPTSISINKILAINTDYFYNSFFVTKELFESYHNIKNYVTFSHTSDGKNNPQTIAKISEYSDIEYGEIATNVDEVALNYYSIIELFEEYKNIEFDDLESIADDIIGKRVNLYYLDYETFQYIEYNLKVVGINNTKVNRDGISEELMAKLTKKTVDVDSFLKLENNIDQIVKSYKAQGENLRNREIATKELEPNYSKVNVYLDVISTLSIIFILLLLTIIIIITYIYNNNQKVNIKTLSLIGYSDNTIARIYTSITFLKVIIGAMLSLIFSRIIISIFNKVVSTNDFGLKYTILFNSRLWTTMIFLSVIIISIIISYLLTLRTLRKGVKS